MIEIKSDSEAYAELRRILADAATHTVRIEERANGAVSIKQNGGMWTPNLRTWPTWPTDRPMHPMPCNKVYPWQNCYCPTQTTN